MNARSPSIAILAMLACSAGCSSDDGNPPPSSPAPSPPANFYTADVVAVDIVNKDSGEALDVGGLPVQGGLLVVE